MKKDPRKAKLAIALSSAWTENEKTMGEHAAYLVSCEQLGINPDDGYSLLWHHPNSVRCTGKCKKHNHDRN